MSGKKVGQKLEDRIREYYAKNPSEYLTRDDMVVKFCANMSTVEKATTKLRAAGLLTSAHVYYLAGGQE